MKSNFGVVVTVLVALIVGACTRETPPSDPPNRATPIVAAVAAAESAVSRPIEPSLEERMREEYQACWPAEKNPSVGSVVDVERMVSKLSECDPRRAVFTIDGKVRDDAFFLLYDPNEKPIVSYDVGAGYHLLQNLQSVALKFRSVKQAFDQLPVLQRREILAPAADVAAKYIVGYVHEDHLKEWLLNLDWDRDVVPVDPDWYLGMNWPANRLEKVAIEGFNQKLSKVDLWVRMFWLRRGELVFETAKNAVAKELTPKR